MVCRSELLNQGRYGPFDAFRLARFYGLAGWQSGRLEYGLGSPNTRAAGARHRTRRAVAHTIRNVTEQFQIREDGRLYLEAASLAGW